MKEDFNNLVSMTKAIDQLKAQGQEISREVLAALSPSAPTSRRTRRLQLAARGGRRAAGREE